MSATVAELLELPVYREHARVRNDAALDKDVNYFTVMEAPDFHVDTLSGQVFILTTLSAHYRSLEEINRVIEELARANVSGIGIKLGRFVDELDESTVAITRRYGVPLITFDSAAKFREILSESLALISDRQRQIIDQINLLNHELFDAILHNRSMNSIIALMCRKIECYGCCMDMDGNRIAEASSLEGPLDVDAVREAIRRFYADWLPESGQPYLQYENVLVFPCQAQQGTLGILCLALASGRMELVLPLAEVIVNAISVKFLEHDLKRQAKRELTTSILDELLFTPYQEESAILERLEALKFKVQKSYFLTGLRLCTQEGATRGISHVVGVLQSVFDQRFDSCIVFTHGDRYMALLGCKTPRTPAACRKVMQYCAQTISASLRIPVNLGCSLPFSDLRGLPESYNQVKSAMQYGHSLNPEAGVYLYEDYFEVGLLAQSINTPAGDIFFRRIIDPIAEYDRKYSSKLWDTLEACFVSGSLEKAAAALFIHISTLRYRLEKIHTLTGCNYFDIKGRMLLYLAYLLYKI